MADPVEVIEASQGSIQPSSLINQAEIEQQIATAKRWPRSISIFVEKATEMVTLTERIASDCIYALPRAGKTIEGPSARFGEIIASAWGNCRAGARVVGEERDYVIAQGGFIDLERNMAITFEVKRRIVDSNGRRYNADMITMTGNAACSIALRNAILKGIPKSFWGEIYDAAKKTAIGDVKTIANRRADMIEYFGKMGIKPEQIFEKLEVVGVDDIGPDELLVLKGLATALKDGDTSIDEQFPSVGKKPAAKRGTAGLKEKITAKAEEKGKEEAAVDRPADPTVDEILSLIAGAKDEPELQALWNLHVKDKYAGKEKRADFERIATAFNDRILALQGGAK